MYHSTLDAATLEKLISAAVAAPSIHNTQPWRYHLKTETTTLEVRAAPERGLPLTDPAGRAVHISVGASIFNLRVAVSHFGWEPVVRLLPRPPEPGLLAAVHLGGPLLTETGQGRDLYAAVWRRHSSRMPFSDRAVPPALLAELADAAREEGAALHLPDEEETDWVLRLTAEGERRNTTDPEKRDESRRWILEDEGPYGLPVQALGPQDALGRVPVRDFSALHPGHHVPMAVFESRPVLAVLTTRTDEPAEWLRAGQALERILLVATDAGLRSSMLHQAMEWPDLRWAMREVRSGPNHAQLVLRLGYGPEGAATPRRAAREVLEVARLPGRQAPMARAAKDSPARPDQAGAGREHPAEFGQVGHRTNGPS